MKNSNIEKNVTKQAQNKQNGNQNQENRTEKRKSQSLIERKAEFEKQNHESEIVFQIMQDFEERRAARKPFELNFALCMNFALGNQYSYISPRGEVEENEKIFSWESREVFNHIAPIVETRLAKLSRVRPTMSVRPSGNEDSDLFSAKMATSILKSVISKVKLDEIVSEATVWSEICGTSFFKVTWNSDKGDILAKNENGKIHEGDIEISVCPPFEIFPDSNGSCTIDDCESIIHAKAFPVDYVFENWEIEVEGADIDVFTLENSYEFGGVTGGINISKIIKAKKRNHVLIVEKYEKPTEKFPNGRLTVVASNKLLFEGDLPWEIGESNKRGFPFVRQISNKTVGSFWGTSVVERCIPIQRAYNAIKNRKHEFMTRLASGVLAVEDGSVDVDNLEEEGLAPGKILIYRAGSAVPRYMDAGSIPNEFSSEEDRLLSEFIALSGVSEIMRSSSTPTSVTSGVALNLLVEQDDTRLSSTAEQIRFSVREIGTKILRLFKQFATTKRLGKIVDENGEIEIFFFESGDISSDEVVLETTNEMSETPASRKTMVLDLFKNGLFQDENGKLSNRMRAKLLDALGFGTWENAQDIATLNVKRANKENMEFEKLKCLEIDDHEIHIAEHSKFVLSSTSKLSEKRIEQILKHIETHENMKLQARAKNSISNGSILSNEKN